MDFTFGIISNGANIERIIQSIYDLNIPNFEIIIVGKAVYDSKDRVINIEFDENIKPNWITKKKNIIVERSKYNNIVLLHDYFIFHKDWYEGFIKYGNDWDICVNKILTIDNKRFRDYILSPYHPWWNQVAFKPNKCLLPYDFKNNEKLNKFMYVSGGYYLIKKNIALKYPLNEDLVHCGGEDGELSIRLARDNIIIRCNPYSTVQMIKNKDECESRLTLELSHDELNYFLKELEST